MGTLKTDTITGLGDNNEITFLSNKFTGTASGNITLPGEGGTTTTPLQGGLIKVRCLASMADNSIYGSNNISSLGDDGTGILGHNFTNNMANRTYSTMQVGVYADTTGFQNTGQTSIETDEVTLKAGDASGSAYDMNPFSMAIVGDLA
jgi:hypothetical protein